MIHGGFAGIPCDASVCLNPVGPSPSIEKWWSHPNRAWESYPSPYAEKACAHLARALQTGDRPLLLGNGCGELFALALRALDIQDAYVIRPCYGGYAESAKWAGSTLHTLDLPESIWGATSQDNFALEQAIMQSIGTMERNTHTALFLANPNNPDGRLLTWDFVCQIADSLHDGYLLLDQSYMDFVELPGQDTLYRTKSDCLPENVLVFQSFTKFFSIAGTRLACVYGPRTLLSKLQNLQLPWTVNGPAQEIAQLLYTDQEWLDHTASALPLSRERSRKFWAHADLTFCNRHVPWLFARLPMHQAGDSMLKNCLAQGIAIRIFESGIPGIERYVRIGLFLPHRHYEPARLDTP